MGEVRAVTTIEALVREIQRYLAVVEALRRRSHEPPGARKQTQEEER